MPVKREPCRNFQRGSCRYGDRCKFLHVVQQQPKPSNPFGFGSGQQQQPKPSNPFGFGSGQQQQQQQQHQFGFGDQSSRGGSGGFGNNQQQFKPFENKWSRFNPSDNGAGHAPSFAKQQPDNKSQAANHTCTDPESCRRLIAEDFEHERPIWKLTCYSHARNGPCDIVGDISYEELRAAAYDDGKRGVHLQSIVERERNLSNSKLVEFQNLLQTPYVPRPGSVVGIQNPFPGATTNGISPTGPSSAPPQVSSFSQLGPSLNTGFAARPSVPVTNNVLNQPNAFSSSFPTLNPFGARPPSQLFGQPIIFPSSTQNSGAFGTNNIPSANVAGGFPSSSAVGGTGSSPFSSLAASPQSFAVQNPVSTNLITESTRIPSVTSGAKEVKGSGDMSMWAKETWIPGEIPEEAPADEYVY